MENSPINTSLYLEKHPLLNEDVYEKRQKYYSFLAYFSQGNSSRFTQSVLDLYANRLLNGGANSLEPSPSMKGLFKYRYFLYMDVWFINALHDSQIALDLLNSMNEQATIGRVFKKKAMQLYQRIYYKDVTVKLSHLAEFFPYWDRNAVFSSEPIRTIAFTANMSAGKSTLINALVGKKVNKSQSMACTAKLHYILNKPLEDGLFAEDDHVLNLDADYNTLMNDDKDNESHSIIVSTYFRFISGIQNPICFLDTPGVNSALDSTHKAITDTELGKKQFDVLIYVINADGGIATEDENAYLSQLSETSINAPVLFLVNKIDCFRAGEDNIAESISKIKNDVERHGFSNAQVYPVSAYAGCLAKRMFFDNDLDEEDFDDYNLLRRKFTSEDYNLDAFYPKEMIDACTQMIEKEGDSRKKKAVQLLCNCGILPLELILKNYFGGI